MDFACRFKPGTFAAPRVITLTNQFCIQLHRLGYAVQRQIASDIQTLAILLHLGRGKGRLRVFRHVEEICAAQVLIALGVVGIQAVGIQGHVDLIGRRITLIKGEGAVEILEGAIQPAVAQMLDAEIHKGVLTLFINFVVGCHRGAGGEQQRT